MHRDRRARRPAWRSTFRHAPRPATRVRWRAPDDLGTALTCFRHAIRAHRRLARLAPRFFDSAWVERGRREQEARRHWVDSCQAALLKVYGAIPSLAPADPDLPSLPQPRTRLVVERELAACRTWLTLGSDALRRSQIRHPHSSVNLSRLAQLLQVATALGHLATGDASAIPQNEPSIYTRAWADLKRIYGDHIEPPRVHDLVSA